MTKTIDDVIGQAPGLAEFRQMDDKAKAVKLAQMRADAIQKWQDELGFDHAEAETAVDTARVVHQVIGSLAFSGAIAAEDFEHITEMTVTGVEHIARDAALVELAMQTPGLDQIPVWARKPVGIVSLAVGGALSHQVEDHGMPSEIGRALAATVSTFLSNHLAENYPRPDQAVN